jgi:adenylosuccinate synthase
MSTLVVVGAQWGDEGKGKVVDVLSAEADVVARFSGGNNAGHTLVVEGHKLVTHLVPSGCRYPGTLCVLGPGMVVDPEVFQAEVAELRGHGLLAQDELRVSAHAHVIFPFHRDLDGLREDALKDSKIGTTRRGIGPAYEAKAGRRGIRVCDLSDPECLRERLETNRRIIGAELERLSEGACTLDVDAMMGLAAGWARWLEPMICDAGDLIATAVGEGQRVLFEGAQGALLDLDHGTYPFVTSTSTGAGAASTGIGIGPTLIDAVWGITKAYTTRVGSGPFPTKLEGDEADRLREAGAEYGATTGRPRDCGWLDLVALKHAARVNGLTGLCVTKLDVLAALPEAKVCTGYRDGVDPERDGWHRADPIYESISGWGDPTWSATLAQARSIDALPRAVRAYLDLIVDAIGVPLSLVSVGPGRAQTISLASAF